jgi:hypothetical protein
MLRPLPLCLAGLCLLAIPGLARAHWQQVHVELRSPADLERLLASGVELDLCGFVRDEAGASFPLHAEELPLLEQAGFAPTVQIADLEAHYRDRLSASRDFGAYHTVDETYAEILQLHLDHPGLVSAPDTIGTSIQGNPILAVKISDNVGQDEDEPELLYTALIHAREIITVEIVLDLMHTLAEDYGTDPRITHLVDNREFWFVPVVNPDGVLYNQQTNPNGGGLWRKNRRNNGDGTFGVDLNRNFGYRWGHDDEGSSPSPSSETYRGTAGFSEPELQGLRDFQASRNFSQALHYHSYSNLYLHPWDFEETLPPAADLGFFQQLCGRMASHNGFETGTSWQLLYPVNGASGDWSYGDTLNHGRCFAITPEVGTGNDGFWPQESRIPALLASCHEPNLRFAELAEDCDGSGVADALEAQQGLLADCDNNGRADACEIADGSARDCDGNGVPDICEDQYCGGLILQDDLESDTGWTVGGPQDDATAGLWTRVDPNGTDAQPEDDRSPQGTLCWVTGQGNPGDGAGVADVDNGLTTLTSPVWDLSGETDPWLAYWRWYDNQSGANPGQDVFEVQLSGNGGGEGSWITIEQLGPTGTGTTGGWLRHELRLADHLAAFDQLHLRFLARDEDPGSLVEAAVDDIVLFRIGPCGDTTPEAPGVAIEELGHSIRLSWPAVEQSTGGCPLQPTGYRVERRLGDGPWQVLGQTTELEWFDPQVLAAGRARYRVLTLAP